MSSFDDKAAGWDSDPAKVTRAREVADAVAAAVPLAPGLRLLEYGAGTGLVSEALSGRVGPVTLADSSAGMREVLAEKVASGRLPGGQVWDLDLETDEVPAERFDLAVASLVLHHVQALDRVLAGLTELLAPGGHLCVADLDRAEHGTFHEHDFDGHDGFDRTELAARLETAGLVDVVVRDCGTIDRDGVTYSVFLAVARRPGRLSRPGAAGAGSRRAAARGRRRRHGRGGRCLRAGREPLLELGPLRLRVRVLHPAEGAVHDVARRYDEQRHEEQRELPAELVEPVRGGVVAARAHHGERRDEVGVALEAEDDHAGEPSAQAPARRWGELHHYDPEA
ncbi:class I SAM-dependent DNA methyltransferase [Georgenia sp. Marseille-Q6866]